MARKLEDYVQVVKEDGIVTAKPIVAAGITTTSATAGLGYATGAGGAVTQTTNITTGVTLSKLSGTITTVASTLAAQATVEFIVTNTLVEATDVIAVSTTYAGGGSPMVSVAQVGAGTFSIVLFNATTATTALDAAVVINFAVIKAVSA